MANWPAMGGRELDTAGDGFLTSFDGPGRAIHAAIGIRDGVIVRAGVHTREVERNGPTFAASPCMSERGSPDSPSRRPGRGIGTGLR